MMDISNGNQRVMEIKTAQGNILEQKIKHLRDENISFRDALSSLKSENENLKKFIGESEQIFHSDPSGIIILQKGKIANINRTMLDLLGYAHDEITGMKLADFFHPDESGLIKYLLKKIQAGKLTSEQYEVRLINRAGTVVVCELWIIKIRLRNKNAYLLHFGFIERLKEIERENYLKRKRDSMMIMASGLSSELQKCLEDVEQNIKEMESIVPGDGNRFIKNLNLTN